MNVFLSNLLLAVAWALMTGTVTGSNLALGFVLGYGVLYLAVAPFTPSGYFLKLRLAVSFALWFAWELVLCNLRVAYDVITPGLKAKPGTVAIPLDAETPLEITLLATLVTLTPGTLSLAVSDDRHVLYVHAMFIDDLETFRAELKSGLERRLLELMR